MNLFVCTHLGHALQSLGEVVGGSLLVFQCYGLEHREVELDGFEIYSALLIWLAFEVGFHEALVCVNGEVVHHLTKFLLSWSLISFLLAACLLATLGELTILVSIFCHL